MKKILTALLLLALSLTAALACAEGGTLKVGMECDYAPYNWTQTSPSDTAVPLAAGGFADGYDVQVAKYIADKLGLKLEIVKTEWNGLVPALTSGKIDAVIAGMSPTESRRLAIDFTDPYYETDLVVVVLKSSPFAAAKSLKDLSGARITGQLNTFHYSVIDQIPGVKKQTALDTFPTMTVALASGIIDGYVSEKPGALSAIASNPEFAYTEFNPGEGFVANAEDTTVAVGVQKGSPLLEKINEVLKGLDDGARQQIMVNALENQPK